MTEERENWDGYWFDEPYVALYPERANREARAQGAFAGAVLVPYAKAGRLRYLDLACATGRRAAALEPGGGATSGIDATLAPLAAAGRREPRLGPGLLCADARRIPLAAASVGAAVSFTGCFGTTEDAGDDAAIAGEVARVLAPGGAFLSATVNAERVVAGLAAREEKTVAGTRVVVRRRYDPSRRMLEREIEIDAGKDRHVSTRRVRVLTDHELRARLREAGLTVVGAWGDFDGSPYDRRRSPRVLLLATKPTTKAFRSGP